MNNCSTLRLLLLTFKAVAVQLHCVAHILIFSHEPCVGGLDSYLEQQTRVRQCVEIICGIAMTLKDDASSVLSSQCLFIGNFILWQSFLMLTLLAGMFTQGSRSRECVLDLLELCRQRTGWPVQSFGDELKQLWMAHESPKPNETEAYTNILWNRH
jgi:hypothetical protein